MHGARAAAWHFIQKYLRSGISIVDLCCGAKPWLKTVISGFNYLGIDKTNDPSLDLSIVSSWDFGSLSYGLAVSVYGLQHLCDGEAAGWINTHRLLAPDGKFLYFGSLSSSHCYRNLQRQDPCNVHTHESLCGLALATGFEVIRHIPFAYEPTPSTEWWVVELTELSRANAFFAELRKL